MEGQAAKRKAGDRIGGNAPFGFTKIGVGRAARLVPEPAQQAAIATVRALAAAGQPSRAIASAVQARHGLYLSHVTVTKLLRREGA